MVYRLRYQKSTLLKKLELSISDTILISIIQKRMARCKLFESLGYFSLVHRYNATNYWETGTIRQQIEEVQSGLLRKVQGHSMVQKVPEIVGVAGMPVSNENGSSRRN